MLRDDQMYQNKLKYDPQGPFEIVSITAEGCYELRGVANLLITKETNEQLKI